MLFADLDLPAELLRARGEDRLVIFAGAGVSKGPPSCLPLFVELAEEIGGEDLSDDERDRPDAYLGELKDSGIEVHDLAAQILGDPESQPNDLHRNLLRIFRRPDRVRLVTTNFDLHFERAAAELWSENALEIWKAPGLPVGDDFRGLVYLHGTLRDPSERLILTDVDFGRAYLTEGWARRFLLRLFPEYTVLFVGYSHGDTVLSYLARGLPAGTAGGRFALTDESDLSRWKYLGIKVFRYDSGDDHGPLYEAIADWAEHSELDALGHEAFAREVLSQSPDAATAGDEGRILWFLDHANYWRYFIENAESAQWFSWLEQKGRLASVLGEESAAALDLRAGLLRWIADRSAADESFSARALRWLGSVKGPLQPYPWNALADRISLLWQGEDDPTKLDRLRPWLVALLDRRPEGTAQARMTWLAEDVDPAVDRELALLLFEHLTDVHPVGDDYAPQGGPTVRTNVRVDVRGDPAGLRRVWAKWSGELETLADDILVIGERHLRKARWLLSASGVTGDLPSGLRTAIADVDTDHLGGGINTLIDAVRDALELVIAQRSDEGVSLSLRWIRSSVPLLRRLGLHGLTGTDALNGGENLKLVLDEELLTDPYAGREVQRLLATAYPGAGPAMREELVRSARVVFFEDVVDDVESAEEAPRRARTLRDWLRHLQEAAPDCGIVAEEIEQLEQEFPEIQPEPVLPPIEVPSMEELLEIEPARITNLLSNLHHRPRARGPQVALESGLVANFLEMSRRATVEDFDWSLRLAAHLRSSGAVEPSLWRTLIRGWEESALDPGQWRELMDFLVQELPPPTFDSAIADLLEKRLKQLGEEQQARCFVEPALPVAKDIVARRTRDDDDLALGNQSWLGLAVNRPTGKIALFLLASMSRLKKAGSDLSEGDFSDLFDLLEQLVEAPDDRSRLGRPVVCSQIHFLYAHHQDWAREKLLPYFSWGRNAEAAAQAWDGFLTWGRYSRRVWEDLKPYVEETFDHLGDLDRGDRMSSRFARHLAGVAFFLSEGPMEDGWLRRFLKKADEEQRTAWAAAVLEILKDLDADEKHAHWDGWLRNLVEERLAGRPPLEEREWALIHEWALYLERAFPECVELLRRREVHPPNLDFFADLCGRRDGRGNLDRDALFGYPDELARYLIHILKDPPQNVWFLSKLEACLARIGESGVDPLLRRELINRFLMLGGRVTDELRAYVEEDEEQEHSDG